MLEIYTTGLLDRAKLAVVEDAVAMAIAKFPEIEKGLVIGADRFTAPLAKALHLPR